MKAIISGASGLVGSVLQDQLKSRGDEVYTLVRRETVNGHDVSWNPLERVMPGTPIEGFDSVVHLAGESIAEGRWTQDKMDAIRNSRVQGTRLLCETLAKLEQKPKVLVCASAIGFYGDRGTQVLDEEARPGDNFLADVCGEWEQACAPAVEAGIRVVNLRIGVVLSRKGGALAKMLTPFQFGVGGNIGNGQQWMSWIELGDLVRAIIHAMETSELSGPVNAVSPRPVTNAEFTKALGRVLSRPTVLPIPAIGARLAFGKMADELLLASTRVVPNALQKSGFTFESPAIEDALRVALDRPVR